MHMSAAVNEKAQIAFDLTKLLLRQSDRMGNRINFPVATFRYVVCNVILLTEFNCISGINTISLGHNVLDSWQNHHNATIKMELFWAPKLVTPFILGFCFSSIGEETSSMASQGRLDGEWGV